jgi:hypothetical protein
MRRRETGGDKKVIYLYRESDRERGKKVDREGKTEEEKLKQRPRGRETGAKIQNT